MKLECKIVTCDRCGSEVRLERLNDKELDGGFTRVEQYEHLDSNWTMIDGKDVCPDCHCMYDEMVKKFFA